MMTPGKFVGAFTLAFLVGAAAPAFADDMDVVNAEKAAARDLSAEFSGATPIGEVRAVYGQVTITRINGKVVRATRGAPVGLGDVFETGADGAVSVGFIDESSFSMSENARIAVDEFVFDPASEAGKQDFSILRGIFMWTSKLIGRENPDSVSRDTPVGSLGIRG